MKTFSLAFCALGIGVLVAIGQYASRDIGPVESEKQAAKIDVVYQGNLYTVSECRVQVDLASNMVTATCKDQRAQVTPAPAFARTDSSSWLDVNVAASRESLMFSNCVRYGKIVQCEKMRAESHGTNG